MSKEQNDFDKELDNILKENNIKQNQDTDEQLQNELQERLQDSCDIVNKHRLLVMNFIIDNRNIIKTIVEIENPTIKDIQTLVSAKQAITMIAGYGLFITNNDNAILEELLNIIVAYTKEAEINKEVPNLRAILKQINEQL